MMHYEWTVTDTDFSYCVFETALIILEAPSILEGVSWEYLQLRPCWVTLNFFIQLNKKRRCLVRKHIKIECKVYLTFSPNVTKKSIFILSSHSVLIQRIIFMKYLFLKTDRESHGEQTPKINSPICQAIMEMRHLQQLGYHFFQTVDATGQCCLKTVIQFSADPNCINVKSICSTS